MNEKQHHATRNYLSEIEDDCERDHEGVRQINVIAKMFSVGYVQFLRDGPGMIYEYGVFDDAFVTEDLDAMHDFVMTYITKVQERRIELESRVQNEKG